MKSFWTAMTAVIGTVAPAAFAGQMGYAIVQHGIQNSSRPGVVAQIASAEKRADEATLVLTMSDGETIEVHYLRGLVAAANLELLNAGESIDVSGCREVQKVVDTRTSISEANRECVHQTLRTSFDCASTAGRVFSPATHGDLVNTQSLKGFEEVSLKEELNQSGGILGSQIVERLATPGCHVSTVRPLGHP